MKETVAKPTIEEEQAIRNIITNTLETGGAFSLWRKPNTNEKVLMLCNSGTAEVSEVNLEDSKPGFLVAPFLPDQAKFFFPADEVFRFTDGDWHEANDAASWRLKRNDEGGSKYPQPKYHINKSTTTVANSYQALVQVSLSAIEDGKFEKIVPSRFEDVQYREGFDVLTAFHQLCERHPNAMVSLISSHATGTWLGATPELLVSIDRQSKFKTHALAGTQPYSASVDIKSVAWTQKEIEEQALVSRYIINCFKKIRVREYTEHGPKTVVAGNVMHLKTDYQVDMNEINFPQLGSVMLKLLHPTSAVCGMPLDAALKFLKTNEGYNRELYSGYLGPVNFDQESHLYVNLRCMQLLERSARLYAGAGVTSDSDPEKEFLETEMKMKNLTVLLG
ncbi:MAG: chorismate-binding protein [Bacteroidota bacterium]|jgi:isochorismate synthase|nr:chorismate-binding protein [Cytophagales bacterium]MCE2955520.1 chorismate-binding protein [Flammeovirgaceae bacterium]MCZ8068990.1 chorismate-binding protein [Cytophagales bacterium]